MQGTLGYDGPLAHYGQAVHDGVLALVLVALRQQEVHHDGSVLGPLLRHLLGFNVPAHQSRGGPGQEPVALVAGPGDVVDVAVVWEQLEQLLGVDPVVSGEGRSSDVPERDHSVIGATEQPAGLGAVEHETVDGSVLLLHGLPLVETDLRTGV